MRRWIAVALMLLLANVNVARATSCAVDSEHRASAVQVHDQAAAEGAHQHHSAPSETDAEHTDAPAQPQCCQAMTTCSMSTDLNGAESSAPLLVSRDGCDCQRTVAPASRLTSPEPPPPRA